MRGDLGEDVCMNVPRVIKCAKPNQVCKLVKSLYGLKQASKKWYEKLTSLILKLGYTQSNSNYSIFALLKNGHITLLLVDVDDIILAWISLSAFDKIKSILHNNFKINDLGTLNTSLVLRCRIQKKEFSSHKENTA